MKINETRDAKLMGLLGKTMQDKHIELYPDFFKPYDAEAVTKSFIDYFKNPKQRVYLWQDENNQDAIAAYLWLEEEQMPENVYRYAYTRLYLHHILIMPSYQGQGLSQELLKFADTYAKEHDIQHVELHYWPNNGIAKHTYQKYGYEVYTEIAQKRI